MNNCILLFLSFLCLSTPCAGKKSDNQIKEKLTITTTITIPAFNERVQYFGNLLEDSVVEFRIVKSKYFWGAVFPRNIGVIFPPSANRYTLSNHEIELAEQLISKNMSLLRRLLANRPVVVKPGYPYFLSYKKLKKYYRRYVGYKIKNGAILVRINFEKMPLDETPLEYLRETVCLEGADNDLFDITVNISEKTLMLTPTDINNL